MCTQKIFWPRNQIFWGRLFTNIKFIHIHKETAPRNIFHNSIHPSMVDFFLTRVHYGTETDYVLQAFK
jgi:hypothetical protein